MKAIEKYVEAMENKDFAGLAELFTADGILCDYCSNSSNQREYHISAREAINIPCVAGLAVIPMISVTIYIPTSNATPARARTCFIFFIRFTFLSCIRFSLL